MKLSLATARAPLPYGKSACIFVCYLAYHCFALDGWQRAPRITNGLLNLAMILASAIR